MSKKSTLFSFFKNNNQYEYTLKDVYNEFPNYPKSSIRRIMQELIVNGLLIRETVGHYAVNLQTWFRKILKSVFYNPKEAHRKGAKKITYIAYTFENNDIDRSDELLHAIERKFELLMTDFGYSQNQEYIDPPFYFPTIRIEKDD